ncbi:MAG TPA: IS21 family transposase [Kofleriaceae bacterium]|nr:IS21 family transposase [Kofleriaceae bacterium]
MHRLQDLVRFHRLRTGTRETARLLGMGPNTERMFREAIAAAGLLEGPLDELPSLDALRDAVLAKHPVPPLPKHQTTALGAYVPLITTLVEKGLGPRAIFDRLRLEHPDFDGSHSAVKRLCRTLKRARGVRPQDVAIPVETAPGEVAQVDFGYVGKLFDPTTMTLRKAWCFVMVLGFSRHMVVRVAFDQRIETWLALHVEAFHELGGVPATVVPDNLKAAVIRAAFSIDDQSELNRSYRELARYYNFKVDPTPPYDPGKKGKVEAGVKYVNGNFFVGRQETNVEDVRRDLRRWVVEIAGMREHGTTHHQPLVQFETIERATLRPLPKIAWKPAVWRRAKVHTDAHVALDRRLYSVPWRLIGQRVWVKATATSVVIYANDERVATHDRRGAGVRSTLESHLPTQRAELRHRGRAFWEQRADAMGDDVGRYIRAVFDSDDALSQLRAVQAIVTHLETFPVERARAACRRAEHFASYGYGALKNILRRALDLEPLPAPPPPAPTTTPRFARPATHWRN